MKALYAVALAAMLIISIFSATSMQAEATHTTVAKVTQQLVVTYTDGNTKTLTDEEAFKLTGPAYRLDEEQTGKTIKSITAKLIILTSTGDSVDKSSSTINMSVKKRDGTYYTFPPTSTINDYNIKKSGTRYTIFEKTVSASDIESVIGKGSSDFKTELRAMSSINAVSGTFGGKSGTYIASQTLITYGLIIKPDGSSTDGGSGSGSNGGVEDGHDIDDIIPAPTGRVYSKVIVETADEDGNRAGSHTYLNNELTTFDLSAVGDANRLRSLTYYLYVWFDVDRYVLQGENLSHVNNALRDNYGTLLDNSQFGQVTIVTEYDRITKSTGEGQLYQVLKMTVMADELEKALTTDLGNDGETQFKTGKLTFYNRDSTLKVKDSAGQAYTINIPADTVKIDLTSATTIEQDDGGEIICEGTECEVDEEDGRDLFSSPLFVGAIGLTVAGVIAGVIITSRKKN